MKNIFKVFLVFLFVFIYSCEEKLEIKAQGSLSADVVVYNEDWLNKQLVAAYATLDGFIGNNSNAWRAPASNWTFGDMSTDDAYKGSDPGDQGEMNEIEQYTYNSSNGYFGSKWRAIFEGVNRCNQTLLAVENAIEDGTVTDQAYLTRVVAEARFLRALYHMDGLKNFYYIPYIDETVEESQDNSNPANTYAKVDADLTFAMNNLPDSQGDIGRANKYSAMAFLAKSKLFQGNHAAAEPLIDGVIGSGRYSLNAMYHDNFDAETDNSSESVFAVQNSVNDGAPDSNNGNRGNILSYPNGGNAPVTCCGFFQPSQNLVNAFRTDADGLPLLDTFNDSDVVNDQGLTSSDPFIPDTGNLDPRLDWTAGRRGLPYLGWDIHPGIDWIRDQGNGGPYSPVKHMFSASQAGSLSTTSGWAQGANAINTQLIRYSDVLLWKAEIMAEAGTGDMGMALVNLVRLRAANPNGFLKANLDGSGPPAANYVVGLYNSFPSQEYAIKAVRFERRLELAMEGHRFYDLVRWNVAAEVINTYIAKEQLPPKRAYLTGKSFVAPKNNYYPVPQSVIQAANGAMTQNPNY